MHISTGDAFGDEIFDHAWQLQCLPSSLSTAFYEVVTDGEAFLRRGLPRPSFRDKAADFGSAVNRDKIIAEAFISPVPMILSIASSILQPSHFRLLHQLYCASPAGCCHSDVKCYIAHAKLTFYIHFLDL